jgi:omega-6 fatty acid desaturase (delta-12 desaturase)
MVGAIQIQAIGEKMVAESEISKTQISQSDWYRSLSKYEKPDLMKAIWQIINTFVPYIALWALMVWMIRTGVSYWYTLPLIVVAAGLLVRVFIFFHDCCHGSYFASRRANKILGYISGILTFTPYEDWQLSHAGHHATSGDLDRRGIGDIWTLTVEEYLAAPKKTQFAYRILRHPCILFVLGSVAMFLIFQRFPHKGARQRERTGVAITNVALLAILVLASFTIGLRTYLLIQLPIICLAGALGIWLFYIQHQFEGGVYWERHQNWDPVKAALEGSSYYKLPKVLQWFSGNIGLHHIHHLKPRIPNYNLQKCYDDVSALQTIEPITLRQSFKSVFLNLWDESAQKMVSFRAVYARRKNCERS